MKQEMAKVYDTRKGMTKLVDKLAKVFSTEDVIAEVMHLRGYDKSYYAQEMYETLKEVGVFKLSYWSEVDLVDSSLTAEEVKLYGLKTAKGAYLLGDRYTVPIRDISGDVTALVGWYPDYKKYITTPTYGFSKGSQFFNMECYAQSMRGAYPKQEGSTEESGLVYLVEGIFDTLSLRSLGFPALGNMGLEMTRVKTEILTRFGTVVAIPDNDKSGRGTNKYLSGVRGKGKHNEWVIKNKHVIVQLPKGVKDTDDFIKEYICKEDLLGCQNKLYQVKLSEE